MPAEIDPRNERREGAMFIYLVELVQDYMGTSEVLIRDVVVASSGRYPISSNVEL